MAQRTEYPLSASTYGDFRSRLAHSNCDLCPELKASRTQIVVDRGNPRADIVIIGEGPGEKEDLTGRAFVGRSGQLLDKIMASVGISTENDVLIVNVVKCRPPGNRAPKPLEAKNCRSYLDWQLGFVKPRVIVLLGATAAKYFLTDDGLPMKNKVGRFFSTAEYPETQFFLLYHPAYLLRDPRKTKDMLIHVQELKKFMPGGKTI